MPPWAAILLGFTILLVVVNLTLLAWKYKEEIREYLGTEPGKKLLDKLKSKATRYAK